MNSFPASESSTTTRSSEPVAVARSHRLPWRALDHVQAALVGMQYGQVTVIVQDGLIVQVERTERTRLPKGQSGNS